MRWTHRITLEVPVTPPDEDGHQEYEDRTVLLYVQGETQRPARYSTLTGFQAADQRTLSLLRAEMQDTRTCGACAGTTTRNGTPCAACSATGAPTPACYPDSFDQPLIDAIDEWWDDHQDECWESSI